MNKDIKDSLGKQYKMKNTFFVLEYVFRLKYFLGEMISPTLFNQANLLK